MSGRYKIRVEARFESAHFLRSYRGTPEPLHGHSYRVEAVLSAVTNGVDEESLAVDFIDSEKKLRELAALLDYKCVNDVEPFTHVSPSAENIARWFFEELTRAVEPAARINEVTVWEGPFHAASYSSE